MGKQRNGSQHLPPTKTAESRVYLPSVSSFLHPMLLGCPSLGWDRIYSERKMHTFVSKRHPFRGSHGGCLSFFIYWLPSGFQVLRSLPLYFTFSFLKKCLQNNMQEWKTVVGQTVKLLWLFKKKNFLNSAKGGVEYENGHHVPFIRVLVLIVSCLCVLSVPSASLVFFHWNLKTLMGYCPIYRWELWDPVSLCNLPTEA
jgi:hypothetical protein